MGLASAFNVQLHVPALRQEEVARVLRQQEAFELRDIPEVRAAGAAGARSAFVPWVGCEVPSERRERGRTRSRPNTRPPPHAH